MRILLLTHSFNGLAQRLWVELSARGHEVSVELDINDLVTQEAAALFRPDLIVAPYLKRAIPEAIWRTHRCIVIHPGIVGDRGPSALDWAIADGESMWGVTALQANAVMDGGDVWASASFPMRAATKSSLYRNEVTEAAVQALLETLERLREPGFRPQPLDYSRPEVRGRPHALMRQSDRRIDWARDGTDVVLRKVRAADGSPGVRDELFGDPYRMFDAHAEEQLRGATPGAVIAKRENAICRATIDGAVWIGHLEPIAEGRPSFKLPATLALGTAVDDVPESPMPALQESTRSTYRDSWYERSGAVGYLHFEFYNGAMGTRQCERLREALVAARARPTRVLVLMGGPDFWSNGIHLNLIEASADPAEESWRNINAMNDLAREILCTDGQLTMAALQGNAGAGGVFLALAADRVVARRGAILNPHYKSMGNLYGSEYWTYLLPKRVGPDAARSITQNRLPLGAQQACDMGLIDGCFGEDRAGFVEQVRALAEQLATSPEYPSLVARKRERRLQDEAAKPLQAYRAEELEHMKRNFWGFDPSFHVARYNFVCKVPRSRTPLYLARHRARAMSRLPERADSVGVSSPSTA